MQYQKEIDGLRAIAILPVVLFHAGFNGFAGGYLGVDIFFVISGFLITRILLQEIDQDRFSIVNFYERRARRILPALVLVIFVTFIFGYFLMLSEDFKVLSQGVTASALFLANFFMYYKNGDYFGLQSEFNPILHLWSLAVEEQFYVFLPILLVLVRKRDPRFLAWIMGALFVLSLLAAQSKSITDPSAAFFLLPYRAWELLSGSVAALAVTRGWLSTVSESSRNVIANVGFLAVIVSISIFDKSSGVPGLSALVPVLGTVGTILFASPNNLVGRILGLQFFVWIGLVSYSAYLWHQPILAFARRMTQEHLEIQVSVSAVIATFLLAGLSKFFVEDRFRNKRLISRKAIGVFVIASGIGMIGVGVFAQLTNGFPNRSELFARLVTNPGLSKTCNGNTAIVPQCTTGDSPTLAVLGNSYAMHIVQGLKHSYPNVHLVQLTQDSCAPHFKDDRKFAGKASCTAFLENAVATVEKNPKLQTIVISSTFGDILTEERAQSFNQVVERLRSQNRRVVIVGPTPSGAFDVGHCFVAKKYFGSPSDCGFSLNSINSVHANVVAKLSRIAAATGSEFIDLAQLICPNGVQCMPYQANTFIYRDYGHLSVEGSKYVFSKLKDLDKLNF